MVHVQAGIVGTKYKQAMGGIADGIPLGKGHPGEQYTSVNRLDIEHCRNIGGGPIAVYGYLGMNKTEGKQECNKAKVKLFHG
jgi:hypothetical protein